MALQRQINKEAAQSRLEHQELRSVRHPTKVDKIKNAVLPAVNVLPPNSLAGWKNIPLEQKFPRVPAPKNEFIIGRNALGENIYVNEPCAEFDNEDPLIQATPKGYESLHDPNLKDYFLTHPRVFQKLREHGLVEEDGSVNSTLKDFNTYRAYLARLRNRCVKKDLHFQADLTLAQRNQIRKIDGEDKRVIREAKEKAKARHLQNMKREREKRELAAQLQEMKFFERNQDKEKEAALLAMKREAKRDKVRARLAKLKRAERKRARRMILEFYCRQLYADMMRKARIEHKQEVRKKDLESFIQAKREFQDTKLKWLGRLEEKVEAEKECAVKHRIKVYDQIEAGKLDRMKKKALAEELRAQREVYLTKKFGRRWLNIVKQQREYTKNYHDSVWRIRQKLVEMVQNLKNESGKVNFTSFIKGLMGLKQPAESRLPEMSGETREIMNYILDLLIQSALDTYKKQHRPCAKAYYRLGNRRRILGVSDLTEDDFKEPGYKKREKVNVPFERPYFPCNNPCTQIGDPRYVEDPRCEEELYHQAEGLAEDEIERLFPGTKRPKKGKRKSDAGSEGGSSGIAEELVSKSLGNVANQICKDKDCPMAQSGGKRDKLLTPSTEEGSSGAAEKLVAKKIKDASDNLDCDSKSLPDSSAKDRLTTPVSDLSGPSKSGDSKSSPLAEEFTRDSIAKAVSDLSCPDVGEENGGSKSSIVADSLPKDGSIEKDVGDLPSQDGGSEGGDSRSSRVAEDLARDSIVKAVVDVGKEDGGSKPPLTGLESAKDDITKEGDTAKDSIEKAEGDFPRSSGASEDGDDKSSRVAEDFVKNSIESIVKELSCPDIGEEEGGSKSSRLADSLPKDGTGKGDRDLPRSAAAADESDDTDAKSSGVAEKLAKDGIEKGVRDLSCPDLGEEEDRLKPPGRDLPLSDGASEDGDDKSSSFAEDFVKDSIESIVKELSCPDVGEEEGSSKPPIPDKDSAKDKTGKAVGDLLFPDGGSEDDDSKSSRVAEDLVKDRMGKVVSDLICPDEEGGNLEDDDKDGETNDREPEATSSKKKRKLTDEGRSMADSSLLAQDLVQDRLGKAVDDLKCPDEDGADEVDSKTSLLADSLAKDNLEKAASDLSADSLAKESIEKAVIDLSCPEEGKEDCGSKSSIVADSLAEDSIEKAVSDLSCPEEGKEDGGSKSSLVADSLAKDSIEKAASDLSCPEDGKEDGGSKSSIVAESLANDSIEKAVSDLSCPEEGNEVDDSKTSLLDDNLAKDNMEKAVSDLSVDTLTQDSIDKAVKDLSCPGVENEDDTAKDIIEKAARDLSWPDGASEDDDDKSSGFAEELAKDSLRKALDDLKCPEEESEDGDSKSSLLAEDLADDSLVKAVNDLKCPDERDDDDNHRDSSQLAVDLAKDGIDKAVEGMEGPEEKDDGGNRRDSSQLAIDLAKGDIDKPVEGMEGPEEEYDGGNRRDSSQLAIDLAKGDIDKPFEGMEGPEEEYDGGNRRDSSQLAVDLVKDGIDKALEGMEGPEKEDDGGNRRDSSQLAIDLAKGGIDKPFEGMEGPDEEEDGGNRHDSSLLAVDLVKDGIDKAVEGLECPEEEADGDECSRDVVCSQMRNSVLQTLSNVQHQLDAIRQELMKYGVVPRGDPSHRGTEDDPR